MNPQAWMMAAPGRYGLACGCADCAEAGRVAWDDDDDGGGDGGVQKRAVHCGAVGRSLSADHCRWSKGSPVMSSYHSPGPLNQHHPLEETDRKRSNEKLEIKKHRTSWSRRGSKKWNSQNPKCRKTQ